MTPNLLTLLRFAILALVWLSFGDSAIAQEAPSAPATNMFLGKDASDIIAKALTAAGAGDKIQVHINGARDEDIVANAQGIIEAQADHVEFDRAHEHWSAILQLKADGRNLAPIPVNGHFDEMVSVPVLKRSLQAGDVIAESDVSWQDEPEAHMRKAVITDTKDLIGKSPKRVITQGRPIRLDEISRPSLIAKGTRITLLYQSGNLVIKTLGEAVDNGAKGDVVRVKNVESKQIIEGTVVNGQIVRVSSPDNTNSAEAM